MENKCILRTHAQSTTINSTTTRRLLISNKNVRRIYRNIDREGDHFIEISLFDHIFKSFNSLTATK